MQELKIVKFIDIIKYSAESGNKKTNPRTTKIPKKLVQVLKQGLNQDIMKLLNLRENLNQDNIRNIST